MNKKRKLLDGVILLGGVIALCFLGVLGLLTIISCLSLIFAGGFCGDVAVRMAFGLVAFGGALTGAKYWDMYWRGRGD